MRQARERSQSRARSDRSIRATLRCVRGLTFLALVACGGKSPTTPIVDPITTPAPWASGKPLLTPGERMTYKLSLKGIELASYTITVGDIKDGAITVDSHAKSVGLANMVAKVDDRFVSWIDIETGRTRRFETAEYETNS